MLPRPTSLSSHIRPPCSSTIRRVRVRPRPVPSALDADRVPCWKESKIRDRSASAMPMPVSVDGDEHLAAPPVQARTVTLPPSGVNLTALPTRLSSTCLSRSSSAVMWVGASAGVEAQLDAVLAGALAHQGEHARGSRRRPGRW